jgi:IS4 transposase
LKINAKYEIIKIHKEIKWRKAWELVLESDEIVKLYSKNWKRLDKEIRVIVAKKWTEKYIFVTNILELSAVKITEIYARRWDIEVFFKFIKQEFWFSHFVSRSENGIKNMLYMTLIASILMIVYKEKNKIEWYKEARRMFVAELNELLLIELAIAIWWDVRILKRDYLVYYSDP